MKKPKLSTAWRILAQLDICASSIFGTYFLIYLFPVAENSPKDSVPSARRRGCGFLAPVLVFLAPGGCRLFGHQCGCFWRLVFPGVFGAWWPVFSVPGTVFSARCKGVLGVWEFLAPGLVFLAPAPGEGRFGVSGAWYPPGVFGAR